MKDFPKVLDFGLAKVTEREMRPGSIILTQEGMVFGTPEFMSPEQAQGKTLTPASDIYSLAVILYEVLTGKLPFDAKSAMDFLSLHVTAKPKPLSRARAGEDVSAACSIKSSRAVCRRKSKIGLRSLSELSVALQAVLEGKSEMPATVSHPTTTARMPARTPKPNKVADQSPVGADMIPKTNTGLLVGIAVAALLMGVVITVVVSAFLKH